MSIVSLIFLWFLANVINVWVYYVPSSVSGNPPRGFVELTDDEGATCILIGYDVWKGGLYQNCFGDE